MKKKLQDVKAGRLGDCSNSNQGGGSSSSSRSNVKLVRLRTDSEETAKISCLITAE